MSNIEEDIMSEEAFNELIDNFEIVGTLTEYGRKAIKQNVKNLQKRIKELEEENTEIKNTKMNEYLHKNLWLAKYLNELYIPKQKVKDKIEELKKEYEIALEENSTKAFILKCKIRALEELLEEK